MKLPYDFIIINGSKKFGISQTCEMFANIIRDPRTVKSRDQIGPRFPKFSWSGPDLGFFSFRVRVDPGPLKFFSPGPGFLEFSQSWSEVVLRLLKLFRS